MPVLEAFATDQPIDPTVDVAGRRVAGRGGGVLYGVIRNQTRRRPAELSARLHVPSGRGRIIREIADSVVTQLDPRASALVVVGHRIGRLVVGDAALVAHVATGHRGLAFACQELVERIKAELPIWKHQQEASGRTVWSNLD